MAKVLKFNRNKKMYSLVSEKDGEYADIPFGEVYFIIQKDDDTFSICYKSKMGSESKEMQFFNSDIPCLIKCLYDIWRESK